MATVETAALGPDSTQIAFRCVDHPADRNPFQRCNPITGVGKRIQRKSHL